jgi:hypothetical protein
MRETNSEIPIPNIPITAKEYRSPAISEIYPIRGGPIRKPRKLTLETVASAIPAGTLLCLPAALYTVGTILETPNPTSINAMVQVIRYVKLTYIKRPDEIIMPHI